MEMSDATANVVKSGETCIQTLIHRSAEGVTVKVWALPRVEEFIRSLGSGEHLDIQTIGRHWASPASLGEKKKAGEKKLFVYQMEHNPGIISINDDFGFRLDRPGSPLVEEPMQAGRRPGLYDDDAPVAARAARLPNEVLNISFLRFVGISEANGVSFFERGVYTISGIDKLAERIEQATNRFYKEFLKPYSVVVTVSTMPIPVGYGV